MGAKPSRAPVSSPDPAGLWRAVLEALDSNSKTARLVVILLTLGAVAVLGTVVAARMG